MLPELSNKRFVILGLQGSGKSVLAWHIVSQTKNALVYDVHHEYRGLNRYLVSIKHCDRRVKNDAGLTELEMVIRKVVLESGKVRMFVIDEANRYCPNKYPLPASVLTLNDDNRHEGIALGVIARRPAQLHSDLIELAHYLFIFRLPGKADYKTLEDIASGLGDTVRGLKDYEFVVVDPGRGFKVHPPIDCIVTKRH